MKDLTTQHTFAICAYKESAYLEECILSLLNQTVKSKVIMCTSTPCDYIKQLADKYELPYLINKGESGIGGDWNFAYDSCETPWVTIAHQDDIYEPDYAKEMALFLSMAKNPIIYFCHYYELKDGKKELSNRLLNVKKKMLSLVKPKVFWTSRWMRRRALSVGNPICCPAVTYVCERVGKHPFTNDFKSNIDWQQWELLSRKKGSFAYNNRQLMAHRIHEESTTNEMIQDQSRTKEDYEMYRKFWPKMICNILIRFYTKSQE